MTRTRLALALLAVIVLGACSRPPSVRLGVKEYPADIVYADSARPEPPAPVPGAEPAPAFPGFIVPPAPRLAGDAPPVRTPPTTVAPEPAACPEDDPLAVPLEATDTIRGAPLPGGYRYRQSGITSVNGRPTGIPAPEVEHRVDAVETQIDGDVSFDVSVTDLGATTITTYEIVRRGLEDGLYISQIRTADQIAVDAFTPSAPLKVLPTPTVRGTRWSSAGTDPLHQITITLHATVVGKVRINACGTPVDAWQVAIGTEPNTGQPSTIVGPGKSLVVTGTYSVAPQFGALVVGEAITIQGEDLGNDVMSLRNSFINDVVPAP